MIDNILIDDLAVTAPPAWAKRIERAAVLGPLARASAVTTADQEAASARLSVGRRQFYNLLAVYRARLAGAPPRGHQTRVQRHIDVRKEAVIAQAINVAGAAARMRDVQALAVELSVEHGIEPPSQTSVRTRFGKGRHNVDIVNRLELDCDLVLDLCPLAIAVSDSAGNTVAAWLLAAIASIDRRLVSHEIFAGQPNETQIRELLSDFFPASEGELDHQIAFTDNALVNCASSLQDSCILPAMKEPSASRKVSPGEVIRALFGSAIGRIPIRSGTPRDTAQLGNPVDLAIVRAVVNRIIGPTATDHG